MRIGTRSSLQKNLPVQQFLVTANTTSEIRMFLGKTCVDEGMVKFKGRLFFKQYMPKKPVKYGIKLWMAAHSKTGYTSN